MYGNEIADPDKILARYSEKFYTHNLYTAKYEDTALVKNQGLINNLKINNLIEYNCFTIKFNKKNYSEGYLII